jgi:hypothetical protein
MINIVFYKDNCKSFLNLNRLYFLKKTASFVISELLIALAIFGLGIAMGAYFFRIGSDAQPLTSTKEKNYNLLALDKNKKNSGQENESAIEVFDIKGIPSSAQMLKSLVDHSKNKKRTPKPWDSAVLSIYNNSITSRQKVQALFSLADTLPPAGKHRCYAAIALSGDGDDYQKLILPRIWNAQTPPDLAYTLSSGLISQPDHVKLPAALELMQYPDDDVANLAYSLLWAYFPNEPEENYPAAVEKFLSQTNR